MVSTHSFRIKEEEKEEMLIDRCWVQTGKWMAATSLDNQIVLFGADTFKQNVRYLPFPRCRFSAHPLPRTD